jgi:hypothetical protein
MAAVVTTLSVGSAPVAKTADQMAAEQRDRVAARCQLVGHVLDAVSYAAHLALCLLLVLFVYTLYGPGPFAGMFLALFG